MWHCAMLVDRVKSCVCVCVRGVVWCCANRGSNRVCVERRVVWCCAGR